MNKQVRGSIYLALAASIWGLMYVVSKYIFLYIPPLALVWLRYLFAVLFLFAVLLCQRKLRKSFSYLTVSDWLLLAAIGFFGYFLSIIFQFMGTSLSDAHTGSLITSSTPAFVALFAWLLLKETITARKLFSLLLATAGVILTTGLPTGHSRQFIGDLLLIGAAVTWALLTVFVKMATERHINSLLLTASAMVMALALTTPWFVSDWMHGTVHLMDRKVLAGVLFLGLIATAGAFFLWNKGLEFVDASAGSLFLFFQPLFGTVFSWLFLGEVITPRFCIGSAIIVIAVLIASFNPLPSR
ncbi:MAG: DMT family transporter [Sporolactobacillus sp.]